MLQHKRISKPTNTSIFTTSSSNTKAKLPKKTKKLSRCTYRFLPIPMKLPHTNKMHFLYGDTIALEADNTLVFEPSLLNYNVRYEEVKVIKNTSQKFINVKATRIKSQKPPAWSQTVKKFKGLKVDEWNEWADLIQTFSETYETVFNVAESSEQTDIKVEAPGIDPILDEKFYKEKEALLANYPCMLMNYSLENGDYGVNELVFNEEFIKGIGYTIDTFSSYVLEEGIPQLFHKGNQGRAEVLNDYLKMFFTLKDQSFKTKELSSFLITRNGDIREVIFQAHFFPSATVGKGGVDILLAILKIGVAKQTDEPVVQSRVNKNFKQNSQLREKEINYFLTSYYAASISPQAANPDKVCRIRELSYPSEDDIGVYERPKIIKIESFHS